MSKRENLTGQHFGRLTAIEYAGTNKRGKTTWKCVCDCGEIITVRADGLKSGHSSSCGCWQRENSSKIARAVHTTHGGRRTRLYKIWAKMKERCSNQSAVNFKDYGGRGITVCEEWAQSFAAFRDWALANGYRDDLTIDRIDNDGPYCPENCRWATRKEQNNNRRNIIMLSYNGETHTLAQWAEITGIKRKTLWERLHNGWSVERALAEPAPPYPDSCVSCGAYAGEGSHICAKCQQAAETPTKGANT